MKHAPSHFLIAILGLMAGASMAFAEGPTFKLQSEMDSLEGRVQSAKEFARRNDPSNSVRKMTGIELGMNLRRQRDMNKFIFISRESLVARQAEYSGKMASEEAVRAQQLISQADDYLRQSSPRLYQLRTSEGRFNHPDKLRGLSDW